MVGFLWNHYNWIRHRHCRLNLGSNMDEKDSIDVENLPDSHCRLSGFDCLSLQSTSGCFGTRCERKGTHGKSGAVAVGLSR